ncbi:MAG: signal recognition particle-docking protein FtsY [Bacteroidota bacterium]
MKFLKNFNIEKITNGLEKTRTSLINKLSETFTGKAILTEETLDQLGEILISTDMGSKLADELVENIRKKISSNSDRSFNNVKNLLKVELKELLQKNIYEPQSDKVFHSKPRIILVVGINGTGKTTSIAKLAKLYKSLSYNVLITSADKFRAAANEQLEAWAKKLDVPVFNSISRDPSAVIYDSLNHAKNSNIDLVIIDTAGRLHNQKNLMNELQKIEKVITSVSKNGPDETLLVIDGSTGQNSLLQAREFSKYISLTGFIISKLDGTAKGGIIFQLCRELRLPVKYIGVGEKIDDLLEFDSESYVNALFN